MSSGGLSAVVGVPAAAADRVALSRALAGVQGGAGGTSPDVSYLRDAAAALARALTQWSGWSKPLPSRLGWGLVTALVVAALGLGVRHVVARRRLAAARRAAVAAAAGSAANGDAGAGGGAEAAGAASGAGRDDESLAARAEWDASRWRRELDRQLAAGRVTEALAASWWWLARALAGGRAEAHWTGKDLLGWSRRGDLRPLMRQLERLRYGAAPAAPDEVRGLAKRLDAALIRE